MGDPQLLALAQLDGSRKVDNATHLLLVLVRTNVVEQAFSRDFKAAFTSQKHSGCFVNGQVVLSQCVATTRGARDDNETSAIMVDLAALYAEAVARMNDVRGPRLSPGSRAARLSRTRSPRGPPLRAQYVTVARMAQASRWPLRYVAYEDLLTETPDTLRCLWPADCAREIGKHESKAIHRALGAKGAPRRSRPDRGPKDKWTVIPTKTLEGELRSHMRNFDEVEAHFSAQRKAKTGPWRLAFSNAAAHGPERRRGARATTSAQPRGLPRAPTNAARSRCAVCRNA